MGCYEYDMVLWLLRDKMHMTSAFLETVKSCRPDNILLDRDNRERTFNLDNKVNSVTGMLYKGTM